MDLIKVFVVSYETFFFYTFVIQPQYDAGVDITDVLELVQLCILV
jgi:hypothetical protein